MRKQSHALCTLLVGVLMFFCVSSTAAKILVVAPHPDDEALMFSGVIYSALSRGEQVKVVLMTNGDLNGVTVGNTRQDETVSAMVNSLGMQESNIIFLGYPDAGLTVIYNSYTLSGDIYSAANGQSSTYGRRGLGSTDYHYYISGAHATYNRQNILSDLKSVITDFQPDNIFLTNQNDLHPDHSTTYLFVVDALNDISSSNPNYKPIIHSTIIHGGNDSNWPLTMNPATNFNSPPNLGSTPLLWNYRESIKLPFTMQNEEIANNLKYNTILKYSSQLNPFPDPRNNYLTSFVHKDELFWANNIYATNAPPIADAGQDQTVSELTTVLLDGSASTDSNGTSLSYQWTQIQGSTVTLSNATSATPSFTTPSGLNAAQVLVFQLTVYDGQLYSFPTTVSVTVLSTSKYVNIAPLASPTASSQNSSTGQLATKAIDGIIGGCPGNCTAEWASAGQLAGAWLNLSWPQYYIVNKIVLFDMPNLNEQILSATVSFSDGSTIAVGPLTNSGSGDEYTFPAKRTNSLKLTVGQANGSSIGLAEIQLFGNPSPTLAITTTSPPSGTSGTSYSQLISGTGGQPPYTWSVASGTLPTGLILEASTGTVSGIPTVTGTKTFTVQIKDATLSTATRSLTITISNKPAISTSSLAAGDMANAYSQTLAASGGQTPYTWSIFSGALPTGIVLNPSSGMISGLPTVMGTSTFSVQVQDTNLTTASKSFSITISNKPVISTTSLAAGGLATAYSQTLTVAGGQSPYIWSVSTGTLPSGLVLNASSGTISGTPTAIGTSTFTAKVQDASLDTATKSLSIVISQYPPLLINTASLASGTIGSAYTQSLTATGGKASYTWSITSGTLPTGLTLNVSSGAITGTPTTSGTSTFTVQVKDANLTTATKSLSLTISNKPVISTTTLAAGGLATAYSQTLAVTGGLSPYSWSLSAGTLPGGLALNASSGTISGTPTALGTSTFTVQVQDANLVVGTQSLSITINQYAPLEVNNASLPFGTTAAAYSQNLAATGGKTPYTWSVTSGALPAGLSLTTSSGKISGTPTTTGTSAFTVKVQDTNLTSATKSFSITIYAPLTVATSSLASGTAGTAYSQTLAGTGGGTPYVWSIYSGTLPAGLTLNSSTGIISGTPTAAGASSFTVQVKDANLSAATRSLTLSVYAPLTVSTVSLPSGTTGVVYSQTLAATGGVAPFTWSISSGTLPAGLALNTTSGAISGTPTAAGTSTITLQVKDTNLTTATKSLTIVIYPPLVVSTASLASGSVGLAYNQTLAATGGGTPYTWSISTGALPSGLTLTASSGAITGSPATVGISTFTVQARDVNLTTASKSMTITIISANQPPVANNDSYSTTQNTGITTVAPGVLGNDTDPEGAVLTAQLVSGSSHGTLALSSNGSFTYTPVTGYVGGDSFTYQANDGITNSNIATVTILITSTGNVSFADDFTRSANPPSPLSPWTSVLGTWGVSSGVMNGSGTAMSYSYIYNAPAPQWADYSVEGRIKYATLAFGGGIGCRINPATGAHYAAWVYPDNSAAGHNLLVLGKMWDWTTYGGAPMAQVNLPSVGTGWHTLKMVCSGNQIQVFYDGTSKISVTDNNFDARAPYLSGGIGIAMWTFNDVTTMSVDDVLVSSMAANQAPVAVNDTYSTNQNSAVTTVAPGVLSNDSDPEGGTLTAQLVTGTSHGTLTLNANGSFTYTPTTGYTGSDSFTYRASDGTLNSSSATVTITILSTSLFTDDFTRSLNPPDLLSPWTGIMGTWAVSSGVMNGSGPAMSYSHIYYAPSPLWDNYAVEARVKFASLAFGGGIGSRVNPATGAHYAAWIYPDNSAGGRNVLVLGKMWDWTNYGGAPMAQVSLPGVGTGWHTLKMVCNGSRIQVVYDGNTKIDVTDNNFDSRPAYLSGGIDVGMWTFNDVNTMSVDDVVVTSVVQ